MSDQSGKVSRIFDKWARLGKGEGMQKRHSPFAMRALSNVSLPQNGWFLDIGCGNGYITRWAAKQAPLGHALGIDISKEMIALCHNASPQIANVSYQHGDFLEIELQQDRFNVVFSMEVFYYLDDLDAALQRVKQLLCPGAPFVCVVDYYEENIGSHGWPADLDVRMDLRSEAQWVDAFIRAGFDSILQKRITIEGLETSETWPGSLMTLGRRPA